MPTPETEPRTTPADSTSAPTPPQFTSPSQGVTAPGLTVRSTPSATTGNPSDGSHDYANAAEPDPLDRTGTPSASDRPDAAALKLGKRELKDVFRGLVLGASHAVHTALARTEIEQQAGVWLMGDENEAGTVADPLASMAGRHAGGAAVSSDTADLIAAGVAVAGYVIRNVIKAFALRRALKNAPTGFVANPGDPNKEATA